MVRTLDLVVVTVTGVLSYWARHGVVELPTDAWWVIVAGCLIAANSLQLGHVYSFASLRRRSQHLWVLALAWMASVLLMIALFFFTKMTYQVSRAWMLTWAAASLAGFVVLRTGCWAWLAQWGKKGIFVFGVAVVGDEGPADRLAQRIEETAEGQVQILGIFRPEAVPPGERASADLSDLIRLSQSVRVDEVAVAIPCSTPLKLNMILHTLGTLPVDVKLCVDLPNPEPSNFGSIYLPMVLLSSRPLAGWQMVVKRAMDIAFSASLLICAAPVMLATALLIKLDSPGPVIFRQLRFGFNKQPIAVLKFRTMYVAAEADLRCAKPGGMIPASREWDAFCAPAASTSFRNC